MSELVKVKSKDGRSTIECSEKLAAALFESGKYVRVIEDIPIPVSSPTEAK